MGNRAVVYFDDPASEAGVYLHWNGGPESVLAFIQTMKEREWTRMDYAPARLCGVVVEFFDAEGEDQGYSVGLMPLPNNGEGFKQYDPGDNGVYLVQKDWSVTQYLGQKEIKHDLKNLNFGPIDVAKFAGVLAKMRELRSLRKKHYESAS